MAEEETALHGLFMVIVMIMCLFLGFAIESTGTQILQEAGVALLIGLAGGYGLWFWSRVHQDGSFADGDSPTLGNGVTFLHFDNDVFFNFILPPIIFSAGYTMRKRKFFQNFGTIMLLGVVGSIVTSVGISGVLYYLQQTAMPGLCAGNTESGRHDALDCIILGTILCNVDLVATLSVMSPAETPQLYSILFGEGVINDAVSIVLFDASLKAGLSDHEDWSDGIQQIILHFFLLLFGSIMLGVICGLACSFFFKRTHIAKDTKRAVSVFTLFAYGSYLLAEVLDMSGIMSVFFCGIAMAHYNWYNLSASARLVTSQAFQSISYACEMFVFCYMGFSVWTLSFEETLGKGRKAQWSLPLIVTSAMTTWVVRGFTSVVFCGIANRFRTKQIPAKEQVVIFFSGTMRGCVAFALALKVDEDGLDKDGEALESGVFSTTILAISIFTTLAFGGVSAPILTALGLRKPQSHGGHTGDRGGGPGSVASERLRKPLLQKLGVGQPAGASLEDPLLMGSPSYSGLLTGNVRAPAGLHLGTAPPDSPIAVDESIEQQSGIDGDDLAADHSGMSGDDNVRELHIGHRITSEDDVKDSAGKLFRHPSAVGNEAEGLGLSMQTAGSPSSTKPGKFGKLHRLWRQLDEEWFKPWFGGLPRTPTALEQRHKALLGELAEAEAKLHDDRRTAVAAEELVGSLELEVADITKQINLVKERARLSRQKAAAETAAKRAASGVTRPVSEATPADQSVTAESGRDGSE